ncbi:thrombospondin type 3 repeat-containing protein [Lutibacter sp. A80]|uniref:choice-of-anchor tandem repeat GloVer-containing protein n=1 Tax=Lutibacter sp. A80 TaxID=2918453 RepID=UPI001F05F074|nr:choice-of-anchor tandem repeat GloVer-containing protein [Lutibacter sp. A80]UMB60266.1 thrombospondin type 3 repeat-containing protein [Lutibacter sp. A80]
MKKIYYIQLICILLLSVIVTAQTSDELWSKSSVLAKKSSKKVEKEVFPNEFEVYTLNFALLKSKLENTSKRKGEVGKSKKIISFPNGSGELERFEVFEDPLFEESFQLKYPDIRTYRGKSLDKQGSTVWFCVNPIGLNSFIMDLENGSINIEPYTSDNKSYIIYNKNSIPHADSFDCGYDELNSNIIQSKSKVHSKNANANDGNIRAYTLVVIPTAEYANWALTQGYETLPVKHRVIIQMALTIGAVESIYRRDLGIKFNLIDVTNMMSFDTNTDGLTNDDKYKLLEETPTRINQFLSQSNYDIGHVFAKSNFGGVAVSGVCQPFIKAMGVSGASNPSGSYFEGVVAHEIGHQFGANHTFNSNVTGCFENINNSTAVEPGSGTTIMSYVGNCYPHNVQSSKDKYFHLVNIREIWDNITSGTGTCATLYSTGNNPPIIETIPNYTIPISTPFVLEANVSDANEDELTYTWEQLDAEIVSSPPVSTATGGPAFRSLFPSSSSVRYFPNINTVINGNLSNTWEVLPSVPRTMTFGVTVRDNNSDGGQTNSEETVITFAENSTPFKVTSQSSNVNWEIGSTQNITWDVGNSNTSPINCSKVNILLSTDGGYTFPTVLASNVNNDGSQEIIVPNELTTSGRLKVESVNNVFYSINTSNINIINNDSDNDGVLNENDLCPNSPIGEVVNSEGCAENENKETGKLWGVANWGGAYGYGVVFEFDPVTLEYFKKIDFNGSGNGKYPSGSLFQASNGLIYGTTREGGVNDSGVIFEFDPNSETYSKLIDFNGAEKGSLPYGAVIEASNGKLYGMTVGGGIYNKGVLFEYDLKTKIYSKLMDFDGVSKGAQPYGALLEISDGILYGMTERGGLSGWGVIFEYNIKTNSYVKKVDFDRVSIGGLPRGNLIEGLNNKLYGMTYFGGEYNLGIIFEYDIVLNSCEKKIDFNGTEKGSRSYGTLVKANNGLLYGLTYEGGANNMGVLFEYNSISGSYNKKMDFNRSMGRLMEESLMRSSSGRLYGMTLAGGANDSGVLFEYNPATNFYTKKFDFNDDTGKYPSGDVIEIKIFDSDNDGIMNDIDLCPNTPTGESVNETGCSESQIDDDGDGIMNDIDMCPDTPIGEEVDERGCSESQLDDDGDGIMNDVDICPNTPIGEEVNETGCSESQLDDDGDGIMNDVDICPDTPMGEEVDETGCSQSQIDDDGDGIMNDIDICPGTPIGEEVDEKGCSESQLDDDEDGIMNDVDMCLDTPIGEEVDEKGCSESQLDDDKDGIMNDVDICPDTPIGEGVDAYGCLLLSYDNFKIELTSETCPNKNNGKIIVSAEASYDYVATINGIDYDFTNNLTINDLAPGNYDISVVVIGKTSKYKYTVEISEGTTISGKTSVSSNKATIEIEKGSSPYTIFKNGNEQFKTYTSLFYVDVLPGDLIEVKTAKTCEGTFSKTIGLFEGVVAYPNPTTGKFEVAVPVTRKEVKVELYNMNSQLISKEVYPVAFGKVELSLENYPSATYLVKVYLETTITLKILKK